MVRSPRRVTDERLPARAPGWWRRKGEGRARGWGGGQAGQGGGGKRADGGGRRGGGQGRGGGGDAEVGSAAGAAPGAWGRRRVVGRGSEGERSGHADRGALGHSVGV